MLIIIPQMVENNGAVVAVICREQVAALAVNYGISNTIVLEIP